MAFIRLLIKPFACLLAISMVGCTTTNWSTVDLTKQEDSYSLLRVTLTNGEHYEIHDAVVNDQEITGWVVTRLMERGQARAPITIQVDEVQTIEVKQTKVDPVLTAVSVVLIAGVVVLGAIVLFITTVDFE